tara:strand:+ start:93 stop:521 length:429 start_codon:yes stop_codon:yes gene_type:complete
MAKKSMRNAIKVGLGIGAAMLASKMMGDGTSSPSTSSPSTSSGEMDGTEGVMKGKMSLADRAKNLSSRAIDATERAARAAKAYATKNYVMKGENPANMLSGIGTDSYGLQAGAKKGRMMKASSGGSVHVKTKLGYSKKTKIY